jgi:hypothetical protein
VVFIDGEELEQEMHSTGDSAYEDGEKIATMKEAAKKLHEDAVTAMKNLWQRLLLTTTRDNSSDSAAAGASASSHEKQEKASSSKDGAVVVSDASASGKGTPQGVKESPSAAGGGDGGAKLDPSGSSPIAHPHHDATVSSSVPPSSHLSAPVDLGNIAGSSASSAMSRFASSVVTHQPIGQQIIGLNLKGRVDEIIELYLQAKKSYEDLLLVCPNNTAVIRAYAVLLV